MNCVCISGKAVGNAKKYTLKSGKDVAAFTLAVEDRYKDESGEVRHIIYVDCAAYGKVASYAKNIQKGDDVELQGQLTTYNYVTKNGEKKWRTQVHISQMSSRSSHSYGEVEQAVSDVDEIMDMEGGEY